MATQAEMTRHLAEFTGWPLRHPMDRKKSNQSYPVLIFGETMLWKKDSERSIEKRWDPFTSRDTCAEIEARLTKEQWEQYSANLYNFASWDCHDGVVDCTPLILRWLLSASPAVKAEALYRATMDGK